MQEPTSLCLHCICGPSPTDKHTSKKISVTGHVTSRVMYPLRWSLYQSMSASLQQDQQGTADAQACRLIITQVTCDMWLVELTADTAERPTTKNSATHAGMLHAQHCSKVMKLLLLPARPRQQVELLILLFLLLAVYLHLLLTDLLGALVCRTSP